MKIARFLIALTMAWPAVAAAQVQNTVPGYRLPNGVNENAIGSVPLDLNGALFGGPTSPIYTLAMPGMSATGGLTVSRISSPAGTAPMLIKASSGRLYTYNLCNNAASSRYVRFYNNAAPTVGTTAVFAGAIVIAAGTCQPFSTNFGLGFNTAISMSVTAANGDSDTTAATAGDVSGFIGYQ